MKLPSRKALLWSGIAVPAYFVLYFSSVQLLTHKSAGPVAPVPGYVPNDGELIHAVFAPAHFIDSMLLRRGYWAPRRTPPKTMIPDLKERLQHITTQATEADSIELAYKLTEELSGLSGGLDAVDPILRLMEEHPDFDFGSPGPLVHFVETFYNRGYEERLCASIRRRPTPHTVWMLNRLINGSKGDAKSNYVGLLDEVSARADVDTETLAQARQFRALHR